MKKLKGSNKKTGRCVLQASSDMTIYAAQSNQQEMAGYFSDYSDFVMDLSAVEEIDSTGVQLLLAFQKEIDNRSGEEAEEARTLLLRNPSECVADAIKIFNVKDLFNWQESPTESEGAV